MRVSYAKHKSNVQLGKKRRAPGLALLSRVGSPPLPPCSLLITALQPLQPPPIHVWSHQCTATLHILEKETNFHMKEPEVGRWAGSFPALSRGVSPRDLPAAPAADLLIVALEIANMEFVRGRPWRMKLSYIVLLGNCAPQKEELSTRHHRVVVDASREAQIGAYSVDVLKRPACGTTRSCCCF